MALFESTPWVFTSLLIVVPSVLLSLAALWIVRRLVSPSALRKHHDVAGYTFSIIGVLYSVILGFTVINVQERYNAAVETIHTEATMVADLYRDAVYFDEMSRSAIRESLRKYVHYVIQEEWDLQSKKIWNYDADTTLQRLWQAYETIDIQNEKTRIWYEQTIGKLDRLMNARLSREFYSWEHLSSMMWAVLLVGGLITICFMCLFGLENLRMQMFMTTLLSGYLSFMLFLVFSLDHVFQGAPHLQPKAFQEVLVLFDRLDEKNLRNL
jgi:hypothetical protein